MTADERRAKFRELITELDAAYADYIAELRPATTPLTRKPITAHKVDWEKWRQVKERFDAADAAMLDFLRGGSG